MAVTEGVNLRAVWNVGHGIVDLNKIYTNDVGAILRTYGVEAARTSIIKEMSGVFSVYGIGVDYRHLTIIADYMVRSPFFPLPPPCAPLFPTDFPLTSSDRCRPARARTSHSTEPVSPTTPRRSSRRRSRRLPGSSPRRRSTATLTTSGPRVPTSSSARSPSLGQACLTCGRSWRRNQGEGGLYVFMEILFSPSVFWGGGSGEI